MHFNRFIALIFTLFPVFSTSTQTLEWANAVTGTETREARATTVDNNGNVYTLGTFKGTADFDPGPGAGHRRLAGLAHRCAGIRSANDDPGPVPDARHPRFNRPAGYA